jgi:hypothetical protein
MKNGFSNNPPQKLQRFTGSVSIKPFDFSKGLRTRPTPLTRQAPLEWACSQATIVHPTRGRIPFAPYPYQRDFLAGYAQPRRLILKARQIGFSQVFALEALYAAIHEPESTILLVSRSQDLAVNLLRSCYQTYANLRSAPDLTKENESEMGLSNGSRIKSIPANRSTGRGFAATRVYLDEFAYAAYAEDIYQSVSPAVAQGGTLVIGSTPNGSGNLFHELYQSGTGFDRQAVPWWHCPAYYTDAERQAGIPPKQSAWYSKNAPSYPASVFAAEYDCDFALSGLALFSISDIDRACAPYTPPSAGQFLTTVDVGRRNDATVINTFEISQKPYRRVAFERLERLSYPLIQQRIEARARQYPGRLIIESNGIGDPLIENLNVRAESFITTARSKLQALQALQLLFEQAHILLACTDGSPDARERAALIACAWDEDHTPDEVMSLAIFAHEATHATLTISARGQGRARVPMGGSHGRR